MPSAAESEGSVAGTYKHFTLKAALELASPPTWVASVGPCFIAGAFAICCAWLYPLQYSPAFFIESSEVLAYLVGVFSARSLICWILMLACAVLLQSATNTLNDYQDFKSGLDTTETILDETDASIVYNQINPRSAFTFAVVLLVAAAALGMVVVLLTSLWLLLWGVIAAAVVVLYSAGPKPISALPLGELVSGLVLGGVLICVTYYATTLSIPPVMLVLAVVPTISIAQVMQTNNTCDIDRDLSAGRRTLPGIIGSKRSGVLNAILSGVAFLWLAGVLLWTGLSVGLIIVIIGAAICLPKINRLLKGPYNLENRRIMMETVVSYNRWLSATAVIAFLLGGALSVLA